MQLIESMDRLPEGSAAMVTELLTTGSMRRRLQDIGLIEGTRIECLLRCPAGDPAAYLTRGAVIALRAEDSSRVRVELC